MKMSYEELRGLLDIFRLSLVIDDDYATFTDIDSGNDLEVYKSFYKDKTNKVVDLFDGTGFYIMNEMPYCNKTYFLVIKAKSNYFYVKSILEQERNVCVIDRSKSIVECTKLDFGNLSSDDSIFKCTEDEMEVRDGYKLDSNTRIEYEVREPYKYDGSICISKDESHCSMFFHKNKSDEEQEPIYGNFEGLFEEDALQMIENSNRFKELFDYISPELSKCYREKNVRELLRKLKK